MPPPICTDCQRSVSRSEELPIETGSRRPNKNRWLDEVDGMRSPIVAWAALAVALFSILSRPLSHVQNGHLKCDAVSCKRIDLVDGMGIKRGQLYAADDGSASGISLGTKRKAVLIYQEGDEGGVVIENGRLTFVDQETKSETWLDFTIIRGVLAVVERVSRAMLNVAEDESRQRTKDKN